LFFPFILILAAGAMNGSFAVPMKYVRGWEWEHVWLIWSVLAMLVIPVAIATGTVPHLGVVYATAGTKALAITAFYGMIWGAGTVLFGAGVARVGVALTFGIVLGTSACFGTVMPLLLLHHHELLTKAGLLTLSGAGVILSGVGFCARAGFLRERNAFGPDGARSFGSGLLICLLSGLGSSAMSLALNVSTPIQRAAESAGASQHAALNAVWPVLLGGGLVVNATYCVCLGIRRNNLSRFGTSTFRNTALAVAMAVLWSGSNFVYSAGASRMGPLGLVLSWPIFMAAIVLVANALGLLTGEWRRSESRSVAWAAGGCLLLVAGIWIIASIPVLPANSTT
jgi:L-rhamnose-H+ transport protein